MIRLWNEKNRKSIFESLAEGKIYFFYLESKENHAIIFLKTSSVFLHFHTYTLRRQILFFGA